jgi:hypothetical protein
MIFLMNTINSVKSILILPNLINDSADSFSLVHLPSASSQEPFYQNILVFFLLGSFGGAKEMNTNGFFF